MIARSLALALTLVAPALAAHALAAEDDAPRIVSMEPAHLAVDLDAKKTKRLIVVFDRPMSDTGWSFCGGGPTFPPFKGKPRWDTPTKIVADVELEPDHEYQLSLNCPAATNFRSGKGVPLEPVPWSFSTAAGKLPNAAKQKAENRAALDELRKILAQKYSYYDLRVRDWDKLFREHEADILGAKTTRGFAAAAAKMLAPTEDIHLYLRLRDRTFPTGTRAVDPLYRAKLLSRYIPIMPAGEHGLSGRTDDGIGYVMIGEWSQAEDVDAIEKALASLSDCKAMIVDVRPNSGGDELLAQRVAAWFVEGTKVYGKNRYRVNAGKDGFGPLVDRTLIGNSDPAKRITVPVAVLTSRYVMSSNESFVLMMRQAKDCTIVGTTTYGSSGNPKPHELSNGVTAIVPSWQDMRPDGTCFEGEGLAPDVEVAVAPKDLDERDPILERAMALVRSKVR